MISSLTGITSIKEVYQRSEFLSKLEKVRVGGWVKSVRQNKFIELNDGSCLSNLQVVCSPRLTEKINQINFGSSLIVSGGLILTPEKVQSCELQVETIDFFNVNNFNYYEVNTLP
jgi:asparaginyl-tRNA synthetase